MTKAKPSRMDAYCRVSRVAGRSGESFISVDVQRSQIEAWAKMRGVQIDAWHEDLDQSGGKLDRPGLNALLARIENGDTAGIVVAKLDRLSRLGVGDALKLIERIQGGCPVRRGSWWRRPGCDGYTVTAMRASSLAAVCIGVRCAGRSRSTARASLARSL